MRSSNWKFYNPVNIHFGVGARNQLKHLINLGNYKFICSVRGYNFLLNDKILSSLISKENCIYVNNYPDITFVQNLVNALSGERIDSIIAFGGGSVMMLQNYYFLHYLRKNIDSRFNYNKLIGN